MLFLAEPRRGWTRGEEGIYDIIDAVETREKNVVRDAN